MTALMSETKPVGPCLTSLQGLFEDKHASLNWLVIAHDDAVMLRRLPDAIDERSAAMLRVPQANWSFSGGDLAETVAWSVSQAGLKQLLLMGHSQVGSPQHAASWIGGSFGTSNADADQRSSSNRLLAGAKQVQAQIQRSKEHFAAQVGELFKIEEVRQAIAAGNLKLHALFYLEQSGAFLKFDIASGNFEPLFN